MNYLLINKGLISPNTIKSLHEDLSTAIDLANTNDEKIEFLRQQRELKELYKVLTGELLTENNNVETSQS